MSFLDIATNLVKASVAAAAAPIALVADVVTLPASAEHPTRGPFDRTCQMLEAAGDAVKQAVAPSAK
jgi:hypothetical protein